MGRNIRTIRAPQNPIAWTWRWFNGVPLNGAARTNASFLHPATKNESGYFWTKPWHRCAQWKVALVRTTIFPVWTVLFLWHWLKDVARNDGDFSATISYGILFTAILALPFMVYWLPRVYDLRHYRTILSPIAQAIGPVMGMEKTPAGSYIDINRKFVRRDDNSVATIRVSHALAGQPGARKNIEEAIRQCLATNEHEMNVSWVFAGTKPRIFLKWRPAPPKLVTFAMAHEKLCTLADSQLLVGMARASEYFIVDIDNETPHLMVSVGTGGGKSTFSRGLASQLLHNGADVYILDVKRISHRWAKSVTGVHYARDISEIHDMFIHLGRELDRRNVVIDAGNDPGRRIVFIVEEMNMLMKRLRNYWAKIRERTDPKSSPAIDALTDLLFAGREAKMHGILIAQYLTATTAGGTEARENLGSRFFARYSRQSWENLANGVPMPPSSDHPGRMQVVRNGVATEVQTIFFTDEEAILWAQTTTGILVGELIPQSPEKWNPSSRNGSSVLIPAMENPITREPSSKPFWEDAEEVTERLPKLSRKTETETSSDT